jgi:hypothetical protein
VPKDYSKPESDLKNIHQDSMIAFDKVYSTYYYHREMSLEDRKFYSVPGAQWDDELAASFDNRPKLEVNKIHLAVIRLINEYRNNRITVSFVPKNGSTDEFADQCNGLYRADEQDSLAEESYDNAFEEAVGGGMGAWRLRAEYEDEYDEENETQRIRFEPIYDADVSVYFDINSKRQDKSDARECWVIKSISRDEYRRRYNEEPTDWNRSADDKGNYLCWSSADLAYIAEYYKVVETREKVYTYRSIDDTEEDYTTADFENDDELSNELLAIGSVLIKEKTVKRRRVRKYLLSGAKVIEDCGYVAGPNIPIVPMYGKRWFINSVEHFMGHVRLCKDAQRLKNMQLSSLAEIAALSGVEKPIFTTEQIEGHENLWARNQVDNKPYMLVNPIENIDGSVVPAGPVGYTKPPMVPQALAALLAITEQDIADILGNQEAGDEIHPNLSGKAVELVQNRLDMQAYIYMSNMAKAIKRSGEIWLGMAKELFVEESRTMKTVGSQREVDTIMINRPIVGEKGEISVDNDIAEAKYDVWVDVGPSSSSKKSATVRTLMNVLQLAPDPETSQVLTSMILLNTEGEGIEEVRGFFRDRLIRMGVLKPTDEELQELQAQQQNQQPTPNDQFLQAAAENEEAKAAKARADTVLTISKAEKTRAETADILSGITREEQEQILRVADLLRNRNAGTIQPQ